MERFSNKTAIAPTASISIICGGASPGIEPQAANTYTHKTLSGSKSVRNSYLEAVLAKYERNSEEVWAEIMANRGSVQNLDFLTEKEKGVFKTSFEIDQNWVVQHAADRASFIDQAASNNLFFPADVHKNDLLRVHFEAWRKGVKTLYYVRSLALKSADSVSQRVSRERIIEAKNELDGFKPEDQFIPTCEACE